MSENSKIEWCDHTFNPWVGCTKVSPACDHCYAETWAKRTGQAELWNGERRRTTEQNWRQPLKWNRDHEKFFAEHGHRQRVFCASLADVFDNQVPKEWRDDLWALIARTPNLDWLLLTKRPQNIPRMIHPLWGNGWKNVWLGVTVENQTEADRRIPLLLQTPAAVRFLSCEPLLGEVDLEAVPGSYQIEHPSNEGYGVSALEGIDWIITGGESGHNARPMHPEWARSLRDQCQAAGVPFFFKQWGEWIPRAGTGWSEWIMADGSRHSGTFDTRQHLESTLLMDSCGIEKVGKKAAGRLLDGRTWDEFPEVRL